MNFTSDLLAAIDQIDHNEPVNKEIYSTKVPYLENEFLLILKPELLTAYARQHIKPIIDSILEKLSGYRLQVCNVRILNARYLKAYNVMASHYGVINAAARGFKEIITPEVNSNFKQIFGLEIKQAPVYGALELLTQDKMDETTLNSLWKDCEIKRLAGGIYCGKVHHKGKDLFIVNGFHPPQLNHFIAENRMIVTMNLAGNTSWDVARNDLIGNTYPEKASPDSIRGELYKKYDKFGFEHVSYVLNSVHLSAGPLEGLLELQRFNSAFDLKKEAKISDFIFGKKLIDNFTAQQVETILSNPMVNYQGQSSSLFDITELKNSNQSVELIKKLIE